MNNKAIMFIYSDDDPNMAGVGQSMCIGAIVAGVVKTVTNILLFIGCLKHKVIYFLFWKSDVLL